VCPSLCAPFAVASRAVAGAAQEAFAGASASAVTGSVAAAAAAALACAMAPWMLGGDAAEAGACVCAVRIYTSLSISNRVHMVCRLLTMLWLCYGPRHLNACVRAVCVRLRSRLSIRRSYMSTHYTEVRQS
jgi:hypothetical protein